MMAFRKVAQADLALVALVVGLFAALVVKHGIVIGSRAMAGFAYFACVMLLSNHLLVSLVESKLRFTLTHVLLLGYAVTYAALSLLLSWPWLALLSGLGVMIALVVCSVPRILNRS
jgi:hypothetical protein